MLSARSSRRKLNGLLLNSSFCSFTIFHYLITNLIISKDFSFGLSYFELPLIKAEAHFSGEHYRNLLTLYETMYVQRALHSKLLRQEIREIDRKHLFL